MSQTIKILEAVNASQNNIDGIVQSITDYMEPWYGAGHEKLVDAIHRSLKQESLSCGR